MTDEDRFVAIGLLTETNIRMLGPSLKQVFPIPQDNRFDTLLQQLDEALGDDRDPRKALRAATRDDS